MPIRFLIDENMPGALSRTIIRHNQRGLYVIDALKVGDHLAPDFGTPDPVLLVWLEEHERILASYDKKSLPGHFADHLVAGRHTPGIFLFKHEHSLPFIVEYLATVTHASTPEEWTDRLVVVD
jgi:hypothetical protein